MKNLLLLILLNGAFATSSWAQLTQISGTTKFKTKVTYGLEARTARIPGGHAVDILDANNYFFTIKYHDGNGYVNRKHINYDRDELNELLKVKSGNLDAKGNPMLSPKIDDKYKYEIDHIRYCSRKYYKEIKAGYFFSLAGVATVAYPSFYNIKNTDTEQTVKQVGYGMGVLGVLLIIDSNKWMKRI